jgi:Flp pilus assembly CpaE family ATPase
MSAKPGSGATTLAAHMSLEIARQASCRPVLFDLDSRSSFLDFMLKLRKRSGIIDASGFASEIDESLWERLVANVGGVDYLGIGETMSASHFSSECVGSFIDYARRQYDLVSLDIPSRLDDETLPLLNRCSTIFLVCTPDVGSLHMARRRLTQLENEGMIDRVRVVVNRVTPHSERTSALPELLRHDVFATVANSYEPLQRAIESGRPADRRSPFGGSIERLAARCLGREPKRETWKLSEFVRALLPGLRSPEPMEPRSSGRLLLPAVSSLPPASESTALVRRG